MNIGIVVLAAGASGRMGMVKQVLPVFEVPLLKFIVDKVLETDFHPVTVVLGAHKEKVTPVLKNIPVGLIENTFWKNGVGSSLKMGLVGSFMITKGFDALIFLASDMPMLNLSVLEKLKNAAAESPDNDIFYFKEADFPFLIKMPAFEKILDLNDDEPFEVLHKIENQKVLSSDSLLIDINTPEDYLKFLESQN